jgi:hypothetical protein
MASVTIGTNPHATVSVLFVGAVVTVCRIARRQPNTCCEQTCQRRATSDTRPPGTRVSATICAFSSAVQRRRRPGPVSSSTRPKFTLRVIANVKHKDSSKPLASSKSSTSRTAIKGGRQSSAYPASASLMICRIPSNVIRLQFILLSLYRWITLTAASKGLGKGQTRERLIGMGHPGTWNNLISSQGQRG